MSDKGEKLIEIVFEEHELGLGITLRRADDGSIFVMDIVPNSQAVNLDIQQYDQVYMVGPHTIGNVSLDRKAWSAMVTYLKSAEKPLKMIMKRKSPSEHSNPGSTHLLLTHSSIHSLNATLVINDSNSETSSRNHSRTVSSQDPSSEKLISEIQSDAKHNSPIITSETSGNSPDNATVDSNNSHHSASDEKNLLELKGLISKLLYKDKSTTDSVAATLGLTLNSIGITNTENEGVTPTFLLSYGRTLVKSGELAIVKKGTLTSLLNKNHQSKRMFYLLSDKLLVTIPNNNGTYTIETMIDFPHCKLSAKRLAFGGVEHSVADLEQLTFDIITTTTTISVIAPSTEEKEIWLINLYCVLCDNVDVDDRSFGWRHQYMLGTIHSAVMTMDVDKVNELISSCNSGALDYSVIEEPDEDGYSPLHYACILRMHTIIQVLHEASADVTIKDRNGLTPLHWACLNLDDQALRTLCQHVHDTDLEDKLGRTPLFLAITEGKSVKSEASGSVNQKHLKHCIEILLDLKADGERSDAAGTPLISYLAAGWLQDALLSFVKKYHYKVDIAVDTHGYNALHYCLMGKSIRNSVGLGSCLLRKIQANSTEKEDSNTTGGVVTLQTLLRAGARPNYRTRDGKSPIQLLIENYEAWGSYIDEAVTMLVSYGGRIDEQSLTALKGYEINCNIKYDEVVAEWIGDAASNADALHLTANMYENTSETIATSTSSLCVLCSTSFSLFRRQHHCRICNVLCCDDCSKKRVVLEGTQQRACDSCFNIIVHKNYMLKETKMLHSATSAAAAAADNKKKADLKKELFGSKSNIASKTDSNTGGAMAGVMASMNETKEKLHERGEKLRQVNDKTAELANSANDFAKLAKQLNQKSNSWF